MELNKIQPSGNWGKAADDLNQNFSKVDKAVEQVKNATTRNKGYFSSDTALKAAFDKASVGDIAYVGNAYPYQIWKWNGSAWANSGSTGGEESVNLGDYYTKEETDKKQSDTSAEISELRTETDAKLSELGSYVSNHEYARAYTDADGRFLWGIKHDGSIEWAKGVPTPVKKYIESLDLENDEEVERINQLVIGLLADVKVLTDTYHYISNPEYVKAVVDSEGKVLFGIKTDGFCYIPKGISEEAKKGLLELTDRISWFETDEKPEWLQVTTDTEGRILEGIGNDGKKYFPKQEMFEKYNDVEGRTELIVDSEGKILSYRDSNGVKHEYSLKIEKGISFGFGAKSDLLELIKESGIKAISPTDWSESKRINIPIPRCAVVNITSSDGKKASWPTTKTDNKQYWIEFWDMQGNYFKKRIILNAQGNSSMNFVKKNGSIDICNDEWEGDDTFELKFGDWVYQDSFHLKAYYTDPFRCACPVGYQLYDAMCKTKGYLNDYVWKRATIDLNSVTSTSIGNTSRKDQVDNCAKCFPMGFPCIIHLDGDFYGIYSWQIKKHRDNYYMNKAKAEHIHLDGVIDSSLFRTADGDTSKINWIAGNNSGFEVRNPKNLYLMDGTEYDSDTNTGELIDESSPYYDRNNKDMETTAKVKQYILNMSKIYNIIEAASNVYKQSSQTEDDLAAFKNVFETYLDSDNLIDYLILGDITNNYDGFLKNWQWITYNGVKWYVVPYDMDCTFGNTSGANQTILGTLTEHVKKEGWIWFIVGYYKDKLESRYAQLRNLGVISSDNIMRMFYQWLSNLGGKNTMKLEWDKWDGFVKDDSYFRLEKWVSENVANMDNLYNYNNI